MARAEIRQAVKVTGIALASPPSSPSSWQSVFRSTAPAQRKRQHV